MGCILSHFVHLSSFLFVELKENEYFCGQKNYEGVVVRNLSIYIIFL